MSESEPENWPEDVRRPDDVDKGDVLGVFEVIDGPALMTSDVKMILGCSTDRARELLEELRMDEEVRRRRTGPGYIYWRTHPEEEVGVPDYYKADNES